MGTPKNGTLILGNPQIPWGAHGKPKDPLSTEEDGRFPSQRGAGGSLGFRGLGV